MYPILGGFYAILGGFYATLGGFYATLWGPIHIRNLMCIDLSLRYVYFPF